jgi:hypothetical protein
MLTVFFFPVLEKIIQGIAILVEKPWPLRG